MLDTDQFITCEDHARPMLHTEHFCDQILIFDHF